LLQLLLLLLLLLLLFSRQQAGPQQLCPIDSSESCGSPGGHIRPQLLTESPTSQNPTAAAAANTAAAAAASVTSITLGCV
jgi:hypothetical protein